MERRRGGAHVVWQAMDVRYMSCFDTSTAGVT